MTALKRILIRPPGAKLGDFLMMTPMLAGLRRVHPTATITLLPWRQSPPGAWLEGHPLVDDILWEGRFRSPIGTLRLAQTLRVRQFDAFIACSTNSKSVWATKLAGIPIRIGNSHRGYGVRLTHNIVQERGTPDRHEVEYDYDLGRILGVDGTPGQMIYPVSDADEQEAERLLCEAGGTSGKTLVVVNPSYGGSSRPWPVSCFADVARFLVSEANARIVISGTEADRAVNTELAQGVGQVIDLTGKTSVGVLGAILKRSRLHLSIDTGTAHLAAAMQTPCLTVFPFFEFWDQRIRWQPWGTTGRVVGPTTRCPSCTPGSCARTESVCIQSVSVQEVKEAAQALLAAKSHS